MMVVRVAAKNSPRRSVLAQVEILLIGKYSERIPAFNGEETVLLMKGPKNDKGPSDEERGHEG